MVFYRPAAVDEGSSQAAVLGAALEQMKQTAAEQPDGPAQSALRSLSEVKMKLEQIVEASKTVSLDVGENEARVLRFREEKVAELVAKVREKNEGPPSAATLRQTRAACAELDKELTDLRAYQARISSAPRAAEGRYPDHGPPVGGPTQYVGVHTVVHAAGTLSDGLIIPNAGILAQKFQSVFESKAHSAWHIHQHMVTG